MYKKIIRTKIILFSICSVLGCSHLACASGKTFHEYDANPYGSGDHASVQKVGPNQYDVKIQPTEADIGVNTYGGVVNATNRWEAIKQVEPSFETSKDSKKS
jgi:hypothetical protein